MFPQPHRASQIPRAPLRPPPCVCFGLCRVFEVRASLILVGLSARFVDFAHFGHASPALSHQAAFRITRARFYTKTKTVTARWHSGIKDGANFWMPLMG